MKVLSSILFVGMMGLAILLLFVLIDYFFIIQTPLLRKMIDWMIIAEIAMAILCRVAGQSKKQKWGGAMRLTKVMVASNDKAGLIITILKIIGFIVVGIIIGMLVNRWLNTSTALVL